MSEALRPTATLPKAHLHLHFTGSMRVGTVREMSRAHGLRLPSALEADWTVTFETRDERGWFRFQSLYDAARGCVRGEAEMRRIVREAALDDGAEGSRWLEIQVDPTSYAPFVGGITPAMEVVLDEARSVNATADETGSARVGVVMAASRIRHPLEARTLARLAARLADRGPEGVIGFGLSNDERRGAAHEFAAAFRIAERAGLLLVPHGGELAGPASVEACLDELHADRIGHGTAAEHARHEDRSARTHEPQPVLDVLDDTLRIGVHEDDVVRRLVHAREHLRCPTRDEARTRRRNPRVGERLPGGTEVLRLAVDRRQRRAR